MVEDETQQEDDGTRRHSERVTGDVSVPDVGITIPEISHVAFVVDDLEAGMRRFGRLLGIEPWLLYRYEPPRLSDTTYRGRPQEYSMRIAMSDVEGPIDLTTDVVSGGTLQRIAGTLTSLRDRLLARLAAVDPRSDRDRASPSFPNPGLPGVSVELIEPLEGTNTYTEHLDDGHGIHHIGCFAYDDPRAVVQTYQNAGIEVVQSGHFEGLEFWYLDLRRELDGVILEVVANPWAFPAPDEVFHP